MYVIQGRSERRPGEISRIKIPRDKFSLECGKQLDHTLPRIGRNAIKQSRGPDPQKNRFSRSVVCIEALIIENREEASRKFLFPFFLFYKLSYLPPSETFFPIPLLSLYICKSATRIAVLSLLFRFRFRIDESQNKTIYVTQFTPISFITNMLVGYEVVNEQ